MLSTFYVRVTTQPSQLKRPTQIQNSSLQNFLPIALSIFSDMSRAASLPKSLSLSFVPKPSIAFDLDETLISATHIRPTCGNFFPVIVDRRPIFIRLRPGLLRFLNRVQKTYDVFFFSASHKDYGNQVIDQLRRMCGAAEGSFGTHAFLPLDTLSKI